MKHSSEQLNNTPITVNSNVFPEKKSKVSVGIIVFLIVAFIAVALLGTYIGCYTGAKKNARNGDFAAADSLLFMPSITKLHDAKLVEYIDAGQLLADGKYVEAHATFIELYGYMNAEELAKESNYHYAMLLADANYYDNALYIMKALSNEGYKDAEDKVKEIQYRQGMYFFIERGEPVTAYKKLDALRGYSDVNDVLALLEETIYAEGQSLYYDGEYHSAEKLFSVISSYEDSAKYITLISAHTVKDWDVTDQLVESLIDILYFEDASEVLLSTQEIGERFLRGTWTGYDYHLIVNDDGSIEYTLPWFYYGDYYRIEDGAILVYPEDNKNATKTLFSITIVSSDCIDVFCHRDNKTYTLHKW